MTDRQTGKLIWVWLGSLRLLQVIKYSLKPGETIGYPTQPRLFCLSICESVNQSVISLLIILGKMARAQQMIWSNIL